MSMTDAQQKSIPGQQVFGPGRLLHTQETPRLSTPRTPKSTGEVACIRSLIKPEMHVAVAESADVKMLDQHLCDRRCDPSG